MAANSRFAVAVHCLLVLAQVGQPGTTAEFLAGSVNTNPVVLRRLLKLLERKSLVEIRQGKKGGVRLLKSPDAIDMATVYTAVEGQAELFAHHASPNQKCPVGCNVRGVLQPIFSAASDAVLSTLEKTTLSDLLKSLEE